jgi:hypothetical protein
LKRCERVVGRDRRREPTNAPNCHGVRDLVNLILPCDNETSIGEISRVTKEIHSGTEEVFQACLIAQEVEAGKIEAREVKEEKAQEVKTDTRPPSDH